MANYSKIIEPTLKWEGGLSRDPADPASKFPSPYSYKGVTGWHTNKGITYATFKALSSKLGYQDNASNFLTMPEPIFHKIVKSGFWDKMRLDLLNSPGIAFLLFNWFWGSGYAFRPRLQRYLNSKGISWNKELSLLAEIYNNLLTKFPENQLINELADQQKEYYIAVTEARKKKYPYKEAVKYIKGWLNRVEDTRKTALGLIQQAIQTAEQAVTTAAETVKKNKISVASIAAAGIILYYLNKKYSFFN